MILTFEHDCLPKADGQKGCPIAGREVKVSGDAMFGDGSGPRLNEYQVPNMRCIHTNSPLKLVAVDGNRDI